MARLHVEPARMAAELVTIADEDHRYVTRVLRLGEGDRLTLFDGAGHEADAEILRVGPRACEARVLERREVARPGGPELTLLQGLARGEKLDLVVQKATELGVRRVIPVQTERSVLTLDHIRSTSRRTRWQKIAREAARQCGRADLPEVEPVTSFPLAIAAAKRDALKLLFWEQARSSRLRDVLAAPGAAPPSEVVLAVGPEGGFSDAEVARAKEAGFHVVGLGPRILRTETAALVALSVVGYAVGESVVNDPAGRLILEALALRDPAFDPPAFDATVAERVLGPSGAPLTPHRRLLELQNGAYLHDHALHLFGACEKPAWHGLGAWNDEAGWRARYGEAAAGLTFFAEDAFGDQFAYRGAGAEVVVLEAETGRVVPMAPHFLAWLEEMVRRPSGLLPLDVVRKQRAEGHLLVAGTQLFSWPPLATVESREGVSVGHVDALEAMAFRAELAARFRQAGPGGLLEIALPEVAPTDDGQPGEP